MALDDLYYSAPDMSGAPPPPPESGPPPKKKALPVIPTVLAPANTDVTPPDTRTLVDPVTGLPSSIAMGMRAPAPPLTPGPGSAAVSAPDPMNLSGGAATPAPAVPTQAQTAANIGTAAATPSPLGPVFGGGSRWSLTQSPGNYQQVPSYLQASTDPITGLPSAGSPQLTKLGKLLTILRGAGIGAAVGSTQPTFGTGFLATNQFENQEAAQRQALQQGAAQTALARMNLQLAPQELAFRQQQLEAQRAMVPYQLAQAQAQMQMLPLQRQMLEAQAEAANYKEDPNLGLVDLRTRQPVSAAGLVPLTDEEASVLGKQPGDRVPLKLANTASEIAGRGWTTVNTEEGVFRENRITGQRVREGGSPRMISLDVPKPVYDRQLKTQTMATGAEINANPGRYQPISADVNTPVIKQTAKEYASTKAGTAGGNAIAFNTAIGHLGMLWDAAQALNNNNVPAFNALAQTYAKETGSSVPTNFDTIRTAVDSEVAKVFKGGVPADAEIQEQRANSSRSGSPQQLRDNIKILVGLMNSRINTLQDRYTSIMGEPDEDLLTKESQTVLQKIQGGAGGVNRPPLTTFETK